jgi:hypothetical protein
LAQEASHQEDPFDNLFVEEFLFYGGSYLVFPGIVSQSTYAVARLAEAILRLTDSDWPPENFGKACYESIRSLLVIGDAILRRAGLTESE